MKTEAKVGVWEIPFIVGICLIVLFAQTPNAQGDPAINQIIPLIVATSYVDDSRIDPGQSITFSGTLYYQGTTTAPGTGNSALNFDGEDDFVEVSADPAIDAYGKSALTLSAWIYPRSDGEADEGKIMGKWGDYRFFVWGESSGTVRLACLVGLTTTHADARTSTTLSINKWHHVAGVFNASGNDKITVYIDGNLADLSTDQAGVGSMNDDSAINLRIGTLSASTGDAFDGAIDEVRIYNRALNSTEISEHYQGVYNNEIGLALHLSFDGNTQDSSGQGNYGTLYGTTWANGYANINTKIELGGALKKTVALVNSTNGAFTIPFLKGESNVGIYNYNIYAIDAAGQKTVQNQTVPVIVDKLKIVLKGATDGRVDMGSSTYVYFNLIREYDNALFDETKGSVYINDTLATWDSASKYWKLSVTQSFITEKNYMVSNIKDTEFGISTLNDKVGTQQIIWDRINVTLSVMGNRIDVGSTLDYAWTGMYEYDGTVFEGSIILNDTLTKNNVGKYGYEVANIIDPAYSLGIFTTNSFYMIFDRVNITISTSNDHINVGDSAPLTWIGIHQYDGATFTGSITYNDTLIKNTVGKRGYTVQGILDSINGLNNFTSNSVNCIWDRIKIVEGGVTQSSAYLGETETIWFKAVFEFCNVKFDETKGTLYLNGSAMEWSTNNDRWEYTYTTDLLGAKTFKVTGVLDTQYSLTAINDVVGARTIAWKLQTAEPFFESTRGIATLSVIVCIVITLLICFYVAGRFNKRISKMHSFSETTS